VEETQLTVIKGNVHNMARPMFDRGPAPPSLPDAADVARLAASTRLNCGTTRLIGGNGARKLGWDLNWANWAINRKHQFARHLLRKTILKQDLEMVAGVRFELTTFGL